MHKKTLPYINMSHSNMMYELNGMAAPMPISNTDGNRNMFVN